MKAVKLIYRTLMFLTRSIARITLDEIISIYFEKLPKGNVLEIGAGKYPLYKGKIKAETYRTFDIRKEIEPDICGDIHDIPIQDGSLDVVIATEVLERCHTPQKAIDEIYRILTKNGICILSTRFICKIHGSPNDYYRFTDQALAPLFKKFGEKEIMPHGNAFGAIWDLFYQRELPWRLLFLINLPLRYLLFWKSYSCPCGYVVYAKK